MARNTELSDGRIELTAGLYDTDDGFRARVSGDAYSRIHVTPQGAVLVGDGTVPPEPINSGGGSSNLLLAVAPVTGDGFADGDFTDVTIINRDGSTQSFSRALFVDGLVLLVPTGSNKGLWTSTASGPYIAVETQPTVGQVVSTYSTTALYIANNTSIGATNPTSYLLLNPSDAARIMYDNGASGLSAEDVRAAIDELAALIAAL